MSRYRNGCRVNYLKSSPRNIPDGNSGTRRCRESRNEVSRTEFTGFVCYMHVHQAHVCCEENKKKSNSSRLLCKTNLLSRIVSIFANYVCNAKANLIMFNLNAQEMTRNSL